MINGISEKIPNETDLTTMETDLQKPIESRFDEQSEICIPMQLTLEDEEIITEE